MKKSNKIVLIGSIAFSSLMYNSCTTEEVEYNRFENVPETEQNGTEQDKEYVEVEYNGNLITAEKIDEETALLGDILISITPEKNATTGVNSDSELTGTATSYAVGIDSDGRWPNNTVYYSINSNVGSTMENYINQAIDHYHARTNLNFVQRTNQSNYIDFTFTGSCASFVGMEGGVQEIYLAGCTDGAGSVIHEIGHAIGLKHEHTRSDRDDYVTVNYDNIWDWGEHNFDIAGDDFDNFTDFDFDSIMLYSSDTFAIGNSIVPPYIPRDTIYSSPVGFKASNNLTELNDVSWMSNEALFDRYFLSGMAPAYQISNTGYNVSGTMKDTLSTFYDGGSSDVSSVMAPYIPHGVTKDQVVEALDHDLDDQGYRKVAAYCMIKGAFNVNSTSVKAWESLLRVNRDLPIESVQGNLDSNDGSPFPLAGVTSDVHSLDGFEKFSRLSDGQVSALAAEIVAEIKRRSVNGPFMNLADFINRRIENSDFGNSGVLQTAIESVKLNDAIRQKTSTTPPTYDSSSQNYFPAAAANYAAYVGARNTGSGLPIEINQANILLPLAPRLSARSDTFKIRAYGESGKGRDTQTAYCEAVVQRVPDYIDSTDQAWDEEDSSIYPLDSLVNKRLGRQFRIISFRWLSPDEI